MAMGKKTEQQDELFIASAALPQGPGHVFYDKLNAALAQHGFDGLVQERCQKFYAQVMGRPSLAPGVYFRLLFVGYFEGIDSERGIAWRAADSLALRRFLGYALTENPPDHSTLSRTRRLIDLETHRDIFQWVVTTLACEGLIDGKTLGIDATTLEANAALRSIIRRDTGEAYQELLTRLAQASGIETPTREDLAKVDKKRKKKGSNKDWEHPHDPAARITKMKDSRTHLAHKAEHAVDLTTGAIVGVTLQGADKGDTETVDNTLEAARETLEKAAENKDAQRRMHPRPAREVVADKGYHSNDVLTGLENQDIRAYISEPKRGRRNWEDQGYARKCVYANRRRIKGSRGGRLMRRRGELVERSFAHCYETGGMRRTHLRGRGNILKRLLIHTGAFNLGLLLRKTMGAGTPRQLAEALKTTQKSVFEAAYRSLSRLHASWMTLKLPCFQRCTRTTYILSLRYAGQKLTFATGC